MTAEEVFGLLLDDKIEEAYQAVSRLYASDKGPGTSHLMYSIAKRIFRLRLHTNIEEAARLLVMVRRLVARMHDAREVAQLELAQMEVDLERELDRLQLSAEAFALYRRTARHFELGAWGEDVAAHYLADQGFVVIERDWRSYHRDIDIVAVDCDQTLVFVEVKTRSSDALGDPIDAVTSEKERHLWASATHYLRLHPDYADFRFDIVGVVGTIGIVPRIEHLRDYRMTYSGKRGYNRRM